MSELKPCPFCGNKPEISETEGCDFVISCDYCGISMLDDMHWNIENYDAKQNVIDKWNTRTPDNEALLAQVEELKDECIKAKDYAVSLSSTINELSANIHELRGLANGYINPNLAYLSNSEAGYLDGKEDLAEDVLHIINKSPQQSLDSLKARIEEETIENCKGYILDHYQSYFIADGLNDIPRKYQTTELLEK